MSSPFASTGGDQEVEASSSSASSSNPWQLTPSLTSASYAQLAVRPNHNLLGLPESRAYPLQRICTLCFAINTSGCKARVSKSVATRFGKPECRIRLHVTLLCGSFALLLTCP